jgi:hypothetical protein
MGFMALLFSHRSRPLKEDPARVRVKGHELRPGDLIVQTIYKDPDMPYREFALVCAAVLEQIPEGSATRVDLTLLYQDGTLNADVIYSDEFAEVYRNAPRGEGTSPTVQTQSCSSSSA